MIVTKQAIEEELAYIEGRKTGTISSVRCQYKNINDVYMDGFEWGWIVTVGGMSGSGKTAFVNDIETGILDLNPNVSLLSFNYEMTARRLIGRKISALYGITIKDLYSAGGKLSDRDLQVIKNEIIPRIQNYDITYVEHRKSIPEMLDIIRNFIQAKAPNGIIIDVDHALLLKRLKNVDERNTLIELAAELNNLKKEYPKLLSFIITQLNREIEEDDRVLNPKLHYPKKKDIFGSDALYQISDAVMVLHRPEILGIQYYGPDQIICKDSVYLHHLKVRDGEPVINVFKNNLKHNKLIWQGE